jgi:hypothetical protein
MLDELFARPLPIRQMLRRLKELNAELERKGQRLQSLLAEIQTAEARSARWIPWQSVSPARDLPPLPEAPPPPRPRRA